jgi:hypothetical protein
VKVGHYVRFDVDEVTGWVNDHRVEVVDCRSVAHRCQ